MNGKFTKSYKVRGTELDQTYKMRKIFAASYFQECYAEKCASLGLAAYDVQKLGLTWIIADMRMDFLSDAMPFWREEVEVSIWPSSKSPLFMAVDFVISTNGRGIAQGSTNWLLADDATHRPIRISPHADGFEVLPEKIFENERFAKFEEPSGAKAGELERAVPSSEVDFNGHLTNVQYAPTAIEAVPLDYRLGHELKSYRIKFMREAFLGERILSEAFDGGGGRFSHSIKRTSDGALLCRMESLWQ